MTIPAALLPQLEGGEQEEDRKNLKVDSEYSSIDVDVTLLSVPPGRDLKIGKRTTMNARSQHSSVNFKVVSIQISTGKGTIEHSSRY